MQKQQQLFDTEATAFTVKIITQIFGSDSNVSI